MKEPTLTGPRGRAWAVPLTDPPERPEQAGTLACWLVEANGCHPFWNRWLVTVIHLRDIPDAPPAVKDFETATHELVIISLDPDHYADHETIPPVNGWHPLTPADVVQQFTVAADQLAIKLTEISVMEILNGLMSPDQDWRSVWRRAIPQTVASMMNSGKHAVA